MTREELKAHCKKQIEMCEMWAKAKGENPCGKVYEEHKMILELLDQKTYDDCISRQDVLNCVTSNEFRYRMVEDIKALPPVTPKEKAGWIPISERLPKSAGVYIVTREFTDGFECADLADACYFDGTSTWHNDNRINHGREYVDKKIKAWMPLPAPFESQESEGDNGCNKH